MYYNYQDVLKRMPDSEIKYINKLLKENCADHRFDLIEIKHNTFIHVFIVTDVDTIEKAKPLAGMEFENILPYMTLYDADGNDINIYDDFKNFRNEYYFDEDNNYSYYYIGEEFLIYWLRKNKGYSVSRTYALSTGYRLRRKEI